MIGSMEPVVDVRRVLLATDLSPASESAAREAIRLASDSHAELVVLSVIDLGRLRLPGGLFLRRVDQERARIETEARVLVARARAASVRATFLIWEGDPAEAILAAATAESVDLIVIGSHERGPPGPLRPRQHVGERLGAGQLPGPGRAGLRGRCGGGHLAARMGPFGTCAQARQTAKVRPLKPTGFEVQGNGEPL